MTNNSVPLDLIRQITSFFGQGQQAPSQDQAVDMEVKMIQILEALKASCSNITAEQVFELMIHPAVVAMFGAVSVGYIIFLGYNWDSLHFKKN